jgi:hypothetical protein
VEVNQPEIKEKREKEKATTSIETQGIAFSNDNRTSAA